MIFGRLYWTTAHFLFLLTLCSVWGGGLEWWWVAGCGVFFICLFGVFLLAYLHKAIAFGSISEIKAEL